MQSLIIILLTFSSVPGTTRAFQTITRISRTLSSPTGRERHVECPRHVCFAGTSDAAPSINADQEKDSTSYEKLSSPGRREGRPMRVAIAGGGVGGLTTALYLLHKGLDVTVYEKTSKFARFGGPIQLASNALSVLKAIDETLFERVMAKFTFTGTRVCGIKDGRRADGSFRMTNDALDYLWNPNAPADWFVKFPLKQCAELYGLPFTGVIDRPDLQDILLDECQKIKPDFIQNGRSVVSYVDHGRGQGVTLALSDGGREWADMLIGADGIWSAVRAQLYEEGEPKQMSANGRIRQGCPYSGYTVFAGETVLRKPDYYDTGYVVYIGPQRYFVTSDVGDGRLQWYAFFALAPGTKKAPSGWGGSTRDAQADLTENLVQYLKGLHEGWSSEIMTVLDATSPDSVEQRDLYDRRPEVLRSWADGNVVLCGDAVHPMMPNLGQGGCQALEDAYVLGNILAETASTDQIEDSLQEFYRQRIVRVSTIQGLSRLASDLIIYAFDTPWSPHDGLGQSWKSYLTFLWKPVLQYVIFPLQFTYLYSFHPTGNIQQTAAALAEAWQTKHRQNAEAAFARAEGAGYHQETGPSFFQKNEVPTTAKAASIKQ